MQPLGQDFATSAHLLEVHIFDKQSIFRLQVLPNGRELLAVLHAVLESPATPRNPVKHDPQVCAVFAHTSRLSRLQAFGTTQFTELMVITAALTNCVTVPALLFSKAVCKAVVV